MNLEQNAAARQHRLSDEISIQVILERQGLSTLLDLVSAACEAKAVRAAKHATAEIEDRWVAAQRAVDACSATLAVALVSP